jgi:general secretion pathway protein C
MPARLSALLIWALVAASVVAWGLRLFASAPGAPANALAVSEGMVASGDLTRLLGAAPIAPVHATPAPEISSRFRLTGVVAPKPPATEGVALIAVDGKMPRAYSVGSKVDNDLVLQSVSRRSASIGGGSRSMPPVVLELPAPPTAATGTLAPAAGEPVNSMPAPASMSRPMPPPATPPGPSAIPPQFVPALRDPSQTQ